MHTTSGRKGGREPGSFPVRVFREAPPREDTFARFTPHEHVLDDTLEPTAPVPTPAQLVQAADVLKEEANRLAQLLGTNLLENLPPACHHCGAARNGAPACAGNGNSPG